MSTAPRIPRIPARGPARIPCPSPYAWYESTALRIAAAIAVGCIGGAALHGLIALAARWSAGS
jgi:hypothetical protein